MPRQKYTYNENRKEWIASVWDGTYTDKGKKHRKQITSKKSSADLEKKVITFKRKVEENENVSFSNMTFSQYAKMWFEQNKAAREINTRNMYERILKNHFSTISYIPMSQITHSHFQQVINLQLEHPRTCQQIDLTFRQIVKSAVRDRILPKSALEDILTDISLPKYQKPVKRPLTALEKQALKDAKLDERKRAFVSILYYCGLRRGEALALTKNDFVDNSISISKNLIYDHNTPVIKPYPKSDNGIRKVPIPEEGLKFIMPFVEKSNGLIFVGVNSKEMTQNAFRRLWDSIIVSLNTAVGYNYQAKKNKGEPPIQGLTPHIFRHNYCTELCYKVPEISTKMIAKLMGDREKMVLEVYSHIVLEKENVSDTINTALKL